MLPILLSFLLLQGPANPDTLQFSNLFSANTPAGTACYRIPAIITAPNGNLIAVIDQRVPSCADLNRNDNINILIRRSSDMGQSWSAPEPVLDFPTGQSASDPSFILDATTGHIFLFYNYMDLTRHKDVFQLQYIRSADNGLSWSPPTDITEQVCPADWHRDFKFITSGRGIQTRSGKLIHTLVNLRQGLHLFASDDHGNNWYRLPHPIQPADESKITELSDGRWMVNSRVNGLGYRYIHRSADEGRSWSSHIDSSLIDPGCNAAIIRYDARHLLFINAADSQHRQNLSLRISTDDGHHWSAPKTIYPGPATYASTTILPNGQLAILFEKDNYQHVSLVIIPKSWFLE